MKALGKLLLILVLAINISCNHSEVKDNTYSEPFQDEIWTFLDAEKLTKSLLVNISKSYKDSGYIPYGQFYIIDIPYTEFGAFLSKKDNAPFGSYLNIVIKNQRFVVNRDKSYLYYLERHKINNCKDVKIKQVKLSKDTDGYEVVKILLIKDGKEVSQEVILNYLPRSGFCEPILK